MHRITVSLLLLVLLCGVVFPLQSKTIQSFQVKDYPTFLTSITADLKDSPETTPELSDIAQCAIALEKTKSWDGQSGKTILDRVAKTPTGQRNMQAMRKLLEGDPQGVTSFFASDLPTVKEWKSISVMLTEHGYAAAEDLVAVPMIGASQAFGLPDPDRVRKGVQALARIPLNQREGMYSLVDQMLQYHPGHMMFAFDTACDGYMQYGRNVVKPGDPPTTQKVKQADSSEYYEIVMHIGHLGKMLSPSHVQQMIMMGKQADAIQLSNEIANANPTNLGVQREVAKLLLQAKDTSDLLANLQNAMQATPAPNIRETRKEYLGYLQYLKAINLAPPGATDVNTLQNNTDRCLAGDALLAEDKFTEAAEKFKDACRDKKLPLASRLDAWSGLLDSDPKAALTEGKSLVKALEPLDPATRQPLVYWMAFNLWRAVGRGMTGNADTQFLWFGIRMSKSKGVRPINEVPNAIAEATKLIDQLVNIDANACLIADNQYTMISLRMGIATMYSLNNEDEKALQILQQQAIQTIPAPEGGWRDPYGKPYSKGSMDLKTRTFPEPGEYERTGAHMIRALKCHPDAARIVPKSAAVLARDIAGKIKAIKNSPMIQYQTREQLDILYDILTQAVLSIDPIPPALLPQYGDFMSNSRIMPVILPSVKVTIAVPATDIDIKSFQEIQSAIQDVLTHPQIAESLEIATRLENLTCYCRHSKVKAALCGIIESAVDRYAEVVTDPVRKRNRLDQFTLHLDSQSDNDIKAVGQRIRGKHLK